MYRLATMHSVMDRRTDIMMPIMRARTIG